VVEACYVAEGRLRKLTADRAILAGWPRVTPLLTNELPIAQIEALDDQHKVPLVYTNVLLRSWESLAKLGIVRFRVPGGFWEECRIDYPVSIGNYRFVGRPDEPILLHLVKTVLSKKGKSAREQSRAGRHALTDLTFAEISFRSAISSCVPSAPAASTRPAISRPSRSTAGRTATAMNTCGSWDRYWPHGRLPIETSRLSNTQRIICATIDGFMAAGGRPDAPAGTKTYALGCILDSNLPLGCSNRRFAVIAIAENRRFEADLLRVSHSAGNTAVFIGSSHMPWGDRLL
jgi:hypothetical protein